MAETRLRPIRDAGKIAVELSDKARQTVATARTAGERRTPTKARTGIGAATIGTRDRTVAAIKAKTKVRVATGASTVGRIETSRRNASGRRSATRARIATEGNRIAGRTARIVAGIARTRGIPRGIKGEDGESAGADRLSLTDPLRDR